MKQQKGFANLLLVILVVAFTSAIGYFALREIEPTQTSVPTPTAQMKPTIVNKIIVDKTPRIPPLKVCPSEQVSNQMPTILPNNNPPSTYFILNGQRRELSEFDLAWIKLNCTVKSEIVY